VTRVVIDTDGGVDDALALLLALRSPELQIAAITTVHGNVPVDQATKNVVLVLDRFASGTRPSVARGAARPLRREPVTAQSVHGSDGLGELARFTNPDGSKKYLRHLLSKPMPEAKEVLLDCLTKYSGDITIITLGPLTNLALLLETDASALRNAQNIFIMGGAVTVPGNITPAAEFNMFADPDAARAVFRSGCAITLVPLDVTERVFLSRQEVEELSLSMDSELGAFFRDTTERICAHAEETIGTPGLFLHDPLAVGVAIDRSLVRTVPVHVDAETRGEITEGMTIGDMRQIKTVLKQRPNADVALDVDAPRFLNLLKERLCQKSS
jgi:inosine-uridine nucleoside N-ribohydrolase